MTNPSINDEKHNLKISKINFKKYLINPSISTQDLDKPDINSSTVHHPYTKNCWKPNNAENQPFSLDINNLECISFKNSRNNPEKEYRKIKYFPIADSKSHALQKLKATDKNPCNTYNTGNKSYEDIISISTNVTRNTLGNKSKQLNFPPIPKLRQTQEQIIQPIKEDKKNIILLRSFDDNTDTYNYNGFPRFILK